MNKTRKITIGAFSILALVGAYFVLKNKRSKKNVGISDDENVVFVNFNGNTVGKGKENLLQGIEGALTNSISINEYEDFLKQSNIDKKYKRFLGKKIYTKKDNVNVRRGANVNNGIFNNIAGTIPKPKSFVGRVVDVKLGDDKKIWFAVDEPNSNNKFEIKKEFSWDIMKPIDYTLRWLRSDVVVVNMKNK
jgi:hypothetical protein